LFDHRHSSIAALSTKCGPHPGQRTCRYLLLHDAAAPCPMLLCLQAANNVAMLGSCPTGRSLSHRWLHFPCKPLQNSLCIKLSPRQRAFRRSQSARRPNPNPSPCDELGQA
jgi:hypothetical protein